MRTDILLMAGASLAVGVASGLYLGARRPAPPAVAGAERASRSAEVGDREPAVGAGVLEAGEESVSRRIAGEALRAENERLRRELEELRRDRDGLVAARARLEAPARWLAGLDPDRFAGLTVDELLHLRDLDLSELEVGDEDLARLEPLVALRNLELRRTQVGDDGLAHLSRLPSLTHLGLRETRVTDAGMSHLGALTGLEHLDLNMLPITDAGLAHVRGLRGLEFLRLNYTGITDAGLEHLLGLDRLARLDLWGTGIGQTPPYVGDLAGLRHLELGATKVSRAWVERFQRDHPEVYVRSPFGR